MTEADDRRLEDAVEKLLVEGRRAADTPGQLHHTERSRRQIREALALAGHYYSNDDLFGALFQLGHAGRISARRVDGELLYRAKLRITEPR